MPLDLALLATTVVSSYLLPYATKGVAKVGEEITAKLGKAAADHFVGVAQKVWDRVRSVFSDNEKASLEQLQEYPDLAKGVEAMLKKKLEQDNKLADDLNLLVQAPSPAGTGAQIIGATYAGIVDLRGGNVGGTGNLIAGVNIGANPAAPPAGDQKPSESSP